MSKPAARKPIQTVSGYETSVPRVVLAVALAVLGIAWLAVYTNVAMEAANYVKVPGVKRPDTPLPWMSDWHKWNYLIGFGLIFLSLIVSAHKKSPLGRGRGVVIGMVGCFVFGLLWIVTFYFVAQEPNVRLPVMSDLGQFNLMVGVGFMAVGFTFATKWE